MKRIILVIFSAFALISCEDTETNTPALQGEINKIFFSADDARAVKNEDDTFTIQGVTDTETLTLHIRKADLGVFPVGGQNPNYATYEDANGNIYATNPEGDGEIEVTYRCISCGYLTGKFNFNAVLPGIDTLTVEKGIFFEVSFLTNEIGDPLQGNAGTFVAQIDGIPFNAFAVDAVNTGNNIVVTGASTSTTILLQFPDDVATGTYTLPDAGFNATYSDGITTETVETGNLIIVEHDTASKTLKGTFSFETGSTSITAGQFNVTYL